MTDDTRKQRLLPPGYLPHSGGPCPVPLDSKPGVIIRGFQRRNVCQHPGSGEKAGIFEWKHNPSTQAADIIAYHPDPAFVEPEPETGMESILARQMERAKDAIGYKEVSATNPTALLRDLWATRNMPKAAAAWEAVRVYLNEPKGPDDDR